MQSVLLFCLLCFQVFLPGMAEFLTDSSEFHDLNMETADDVLSGSHTCGEAVVENDCTCGHFSKKARKYQCNGCKDKYKWGYGCDMPCSPRCRFGCDFLGDCLIPETCKRNSRASDPTKDIINEHGMCEACKSGYYGLMCDKLCPKQCEESHEGMCTRGGKCYKCKKGWYGKICTEKCPEACPQCAMLDNLEPSPNNPTEYLEAGACLTQCKMDKWGISCGNDCPNNCDKTRIPSCSKVTGHCNKCKEHQYFGDRCEFECPKNCVGGMCEKDSGKCKNKKSCQGSFWGLTCNNTCPTNCEATTCDVKTGHCIGFCKNGFWGPTCENPCPEFTGSSGCNRETGQPKKCNKNKYPIKQDAPPEASQVNEWICADCSENCADGKCDDEGFCTLGCEVGFFGPSCSKLCPPHCDGPCDSLTTDLQDGHCLACMAGFTGKQCEKACHKSCKKCKQSGKANTGPKACTACHDDRPEFLEDSTCRCIKHASRSESNDDKCMCNIPKDPSKEATFVQKPVKMCRYLCKNGEKEVLKGGESVCVSSVIFKSVVLADYTLAEMQQGKCNDGELEVAIIRSNETQCVDTDIISHIISDD